MVQIVFQYELLRAQRRKKHLSQEAFAELCDCSPRYLRDLEAGVKGNPSAALVRQMSVVLDLPMEALLSCRREEGEWRPCLSAVLPY